MFRRSVLPIALAGVLVVAACSSGTPAATSTPSGNQTTAGPAPSQSATPSPAVQGTGVIKVAVSGFAFSPAEVTVKAGHTVMWENTGSVAHTVTFTDGPSFDEPLAAGESVTRVFTAPGRFAYYCAIHPSMRGTVIVTG